MKVATRAIPAVLALFALVGCSVLIPRQAPPPTTLITENPAQPRLVTVTGDAEVRVVPDEIILTLGVETWNEDLDVAKSENDEIVKGALAIAQKHGIDPSHVQTEYMSIEPRYKDSYERTGFIGFFVRKTAVVTLRDVDRFEDLLSDMLDGGVTHVHGIQFRTTELRRHRDEARALAVKAAREKAEALATELGQQVGDPHAIREEQSGWWSGYGAWWGSGYAGGMAQNVIQDVGSAFGGGDSAMAPGRITVRARVSASFELR